MATKKVIYKEPKGYFNAEMLKAVKDYEREQAKKTAGTQKATKGK